MNKDIYIHPSAEVSPDAIIGKGTRIWHQVHIREGAKIGEKCNIGKDVYIDHHVSIGNRVKIQNGVSIYNGVTIEDDVLVGPHVAFTNDLFPRAFSIEWEIVPTLLKKGVSIGANATILCGVTLEEYSMVGAGAVVTTDIPTYALVVGNPARLSGFVCKCGQKLQIPDDSEKHQGTIVLHCKKCGESVEVQSQLYRYITVAGGRLK